MIIKPFILLQKKQKTNLYDISSPHLFPTPNYKYPYYKIDKHYHDKDLNMQTTESNN